MSNTLKVSETLRQMALRDRKLSWLGGIAETVARLEEDNARKDDAIAEQARQLKEALAEIEQVKRERDAAVDAIRSGGSCPHCKHNLGRNTNTGLPMCSKHIDYPDGQCFEWRGPCAENGGTEDGR